MFIRILNSEMELATGCTEPGAVALTAAEYLAFEKGAHCVGREPTRWKRCW